MKSIVDREGDIIMTKTMKSFAIFIVIALLMMSVLMASAVFALDNTEAPELPVVGEELEAPMLPSVDGSDLPAPMLPNCTPTIEI